MHHRSGLSPSSVAVTREAEADAEAKAAAEDTAGDGEGVLAPLSRAPQRREREGEVCQPSVVRFRTEGEAPRARTGSMSHRTKRVEDEVAKRRMVVASEDARVEKPGS